MYMRLLLICGLLAILLPVGALAPIQETVHGTWRDEEHSLTIIFDTKSEPPTTTWFEDASSPNPRVEFVTLQHIYSDGSGLTRIVTEPLCSLELPLPCFQIVILCAHDKIHGRPRLALTMWDSTEDLDEFRLSLHKVSDSVQVPERIATYSQHIASVND